ncbi:MAG: ATP-binding cassette domain-containing protein, partial [Candidatus Thorarchaeota archaeon]|nr:ATP-binding cassette domain-containing protein [Candidatus Thorarchaeota archaeon]
MTESTDIVLRITGLKTNFYTYEGVVKALDGVEMYLRRGDTMGVVGETGCGKSVTAKSVLRLVEPPGRIEEGKVLLYDYNPETGNTEEIDILTLTNEEVLAIRGSKIAIVFQDPATYPNPVFRIGQQIAEVVLLHQDLARESLEVKIDELKSKIGPDVPADRLAALEEKIAFYEAQFDNPPKPDDKDKKRAAWRRAVEMLKLVRMPAPEQVAQQYPHELSGGMRQRA